MSKLEQVLRGLEIFLKHNQTDISSTSDEIFAGGEVSAEDADILSDLGWMWDEEFECWFIFM